MTRKDFVETAETIAQINREIDAEEAQPMTIRSNTRAARAVLYRMACMLSDQYRRANSRFDRARFASACGFDPETTRSLSAR